MTIPQRRGDRSGIGRETRSKSLPQLGDHPSVMGGVAKYHHDFVDATAPLARTDSADAGLDIADARLDLDPHQDVVETD
jgi:hypothetical protein